MFILIFVFLSLIDVTEYTCTTYLKRNLDDNLIDGLNKRTSIFGDQTDSEKTLMLSAKPAKMNQFLEISCRLRPPATANTKIVNWISFSIQTKENSDWQSVLMRLKAGKDLWNKKYKTKKTVVKSNFDSPDKAFLMIILPGSPKSRIGNKILCSAGTQPKFGREKVLLAKMTIKRGIPGNYKQITKCNTIKVQHFIVKEQTVHTNQNSKSMKIKKDENIVSALAAIIILLIISLGSSMTCLCVICRRTKKLQKNRIRYISEIQLVKPDSGSDRGHFNKDQLGNKAKKQFDSPPVHRFLPYSEDIYPTSNISLQQYKSSHFSKPLLGQRGQKRQSLQKYRKQSYYHQSKTENSIETNPDESEKAFQDEENSVKLEEEYRHSPKPKHYYSNQIGNFGHLTEQVRHESYGEHKNLFDSIDHVDMRDYQYTEFGMSPHQREQQVRYHDTSTQADYPRTYSHQETSDMIKVSPSQKFVSRIIVGDRPSGTIPMQTRQSTLIPVENNEVIYPQKLINTTMNGSLQPQTHSVPAPPPPSNQMSLTAPFLGPPPQQNTVIMGPPPLSPISGMPSSPWITLVVPPPTMNPIYIPAPSLPNFGNATMVSQASPVQRITAPPPTNVPMMPSAPQQHPNAPVVPLPAPQTNVPTMPALSANTAIDLPTPTLQAVSVEPQQITAIGPQPQISGLPPSHLNTLVGPPASDYVTTGAPEAVFGPPPPPLRTTTGLPAQSLQQAIQAKPRSNQMASPPPKAMSEMPLNTTIGPLAPPVQAISAPTLPNPVNGNAGPPATQASQQSVSGLPPKPLSTMGTPAEPTQNVILGFQDSPPAPPHGLPAQSLQQVIPATPPSSQMASQAPQAMSEVPSSLNTIMGPPAPPISQAISAPTLPNSVNGKAGPPVTQSSQQSISGPTPTPLSTIGTPAAPNQSVILGFQDSPPAPPHGLPAQSLQQAILTTPPSSQMTPPPQQAMSEVSSPLNRTMGPPAPPIPRAISAPILSNPVNGKAGPPTTQASQQSISGPPPTPSITIQTPAAPTQNVILGFKASSPASPHRLPPQSLQKAIPATPLSSQMASQPQPQAKSEVSSLNTTVRPPAPPIPQAISAPTLPNPVNGKTVPPATQAPRKSRSGPPPKPLSTMGTPAAPTKNVKLGFQDSPSAPPHGLPAQSLQPAIPATPPSNQMAPPPPQAMSGVPSPLNTTMGPPAPPIPQAISAPTLPIPISGKTGPPATQALQQSISGLPPKPVSTMGTPPATIQNTILGFQDSPPAPPHGLPAQSLQQAIPATPPSNQMAIQPPPQAMSGVPSPLNTTMGPPAPPIPQAISAPTLANHINGKAGLQATQAPQQSISGLPPKPLSRMGTPAARTQSAILGFQDSPPALPHGLLSQSLQQAIPATSPSNQMAPPPPQAMSGVPSPLNTTMGPPAAPISQALSAPTLPNPINGKAGLPATQAPQQSISGPPPTPLSTIGTPVAPTQNVILRFQTSPPASPHTITAPNLSNPLVANMRRTPGPPNQFDALLKAVKKRRLKICPDSNLDFAASSFSVCGKGNDTFIDDTGYTTQENATIGPPQPISGPSPMPHGTTNKQPAQSMQQAITAQLGTTEQPAQSMQQAISAPALSNPVDAKIGQPSEPPSQFVGLFNAVTKGRPMRHLDSTLGFTASGFLVCGQGNEKFMDDTGYTAPPFENDPTRPPMQTTGVPPASPIAPIQVGPPPPPPMSVPGRPQGMPSNSVSDRNALLSSIRARRISSTSFSVVPK